HSLGSDIGFFRTGAGNGIAGGFTTDAKRFTASFNKGGALQKVYFEGSSISGQGVSISADHPLTGAIALGQGTYDLEFQSDTAGSVRVSVPGKPSAVQLNGQAIKGWVYDKAAGMLTLTVPAGKSDWKLTVK